MMIKTVAFLVALAAVAASAQPAGEAAAATTCPLLVRRDDCHPEAVSQCWSPGQPDVDCVDNGICCFDGCVNACGVPPERPQPPPPPPTALNCTVVFVPQDETVNVEMCTEVPGEMVCVTNEEVEECQMVCQMEEKPMEVNEMVECCTKTPKMVCKAKPNCDPQAVVDYVTMDVSDVITCTKTPRRCVDVPEEVCEPEEVEHCRPEETEECHTVKKPMEWPMTTEECSTVYTEKCTVIHKEICNNGVGKFKKFGKLHHGSGRYRRHVKKNKKIGGRCQTVPIKTCRKEPQTTCEPVNTVQIEYVDTQECQTVTREKCETRTENRCHTETKQECTEEQENCVKTPSLPAPATPVKQDCVVPEQDCEWEDEVVCVPNQTAVQTTVPERVCKNDCRKKPVEKCTQKEATQECRTVAKVMTYEVPVNRCN